MNNLYIGIILAISSTLFGASSSIIIKRSFEKNIRKSFKTALQFIFGVGLMVVGVGMLFVSLKFGEVGILYPITAATYIWVTILAKKYLKEEITNKKKIGIFLIILGVLLLTIG